MPCSSAPNVCWSARRPTDTVREDQKQGSSPAVPKGAKGAHVDRLRGSLPSMLLQRRPSRQQALGTMLRLVALLEMRPLRCKLSPPSRNGALQPRLLEPELFIAEFQARLHADRRWCLRCAHPAVVVLRLLGGADRPLLRFRRRRREGDRGTIDSPAAELHRLLGGEVVLVGHRWAWTTVDSATHSRARPARCLLRGRLSTQQRQAQRCQMEKARRSRHIFSHPCEERT